MALNLTATVNLQLSTASLRNVQSQLNSGLRSVRADIDVRVSSQGQNQIKAMAQSLSEIQNTVKATEQGTRRLTGQFGDLGASMGSAASNAGKLDTQISAVARAAQTSVTNLRKAEDAAEAFGKQAALAGRRFIAFTLAAGSMIQFVRAIEDGISEALKFDREMVRLTQVSNESKTAVRAIADEVTRLSTSLGVSSKELLDTAVIFKQAGLSINETKDALEAMAKAALAPNFDNMKSTAEGAIAIMKQFKIGSKDLEGALGSVNAVAGEFAVEAGDLIDVIKKAGGAFAVTAGQAKQPADALNELLGLFTSIRATTRESAESISTGLRTIFTRIQRGDTVQNLKQVGINLRFTRQEAEALGKVDLTDQFVGAFEAFRRLSEGLSKIPATDERFSAILEDLGGYRQISKVIPLIQQFAEAQKAVNVAQAGSTSLAANAAQAQEAYTVRLTKLKEEFFALVRGATSTASFKAFVDVLLNASSAAIRLLDSLKPLLPVLTALATIKLATNLTSFFRGFGEGITTNKTAPRLARGGEILKMAKGGMVPGHGRGDHVPALLEPGEVVLSRDQVQKKATGGKLLDIKPPGGEVGLFYLAGEDNPRHLNYVLPKSKLPASGEVAQFFNEGRDVRTGAAAIAQAKEDLKLAGSDPAARDAVFSKYGLSYDLAKKSVGPDGRPINPTTALFDMARKRAYSGTKAKLGETEWDGVRLPLGVYPVSQSQRKKTEEGIYGGVRDLIRSQANNITGRKLGVSRGRLDDIISTSLQGSGIGRIFDGIVSAIADERAGKTSNETFDLPAPQNTEITKLFGSKSDIWADLKLNDNDNSRASIVGKAIRQFGLASSKDDTFKTIALSSRLATQDRDLEVAGGFDKFADNINLLSANKSAAQGKSIADSLARRSAIRTKKAAGGLVPGTGNTDSVPMMLPAGSFVIRKDSTQALGLGKKFAKGGMVPAMVMPGEYIFGPDEAKSIGSANLHKMNGAGKYAAGGYVRRLAGGGDSGAGIPLRHFEAQVGTDKAEDLLRQAILARVQQIFADKQAGEQLAIAEKLLSQATYGAFRARQVEANANRASRVSEAFGAKAGRLSRQADADSNEASGKRSSAAEIRKSGEAAFNEEVKRAEELYQATRAHSLALRKSADEIRKAALEAEKAGNFTEADILNTLSNRQNIRASAGERAAARHRDNQVGDATQALDTTRGAANLQDRQADEAAKRAERRRAEAQRNQEESDRIKAKVEEARQDVAKSDARSAVRVGRDFLGNQIVNGSAVGDLVNNRAAGTGANTIKGLVQELAQKDTNRLGGNISNATKQTLTDARMQQVKDQYVATVARQIQILNRAVTSDEARVLASERFAQGLERNNLQLLRSNSGNVLGDAAIGPQVGLRGRARLSLRNSLRQGVENLKNPLVLGGAALTAGSFASNFFDQRAGTADDAVRNGTAGKFTTNKGISGALTGGLTGATLGAAAGGPIGAAVGGGVGAVVGLVQALQDAADQIRDAKIGEATASVVKDLDNFSKGFKSFTPELTGNIIKSQNEQDDLLEKKARSDSSNFFSDSGDTFKSLLTTRRRLKSEEFNRQAPGIVNVLNNRASQIGEGNTGVTTDKGRRDLFDRFLGENGGFARQQIGRISSERGVDVKVVEDQFFKVLKDSQLGARSRGAQKTAEFDLGRTTTAFDALSAIVKTASENIHVFADTAKQFTDLFEGQIGNHQLKDSAEILSNPGTSNRQRFLGAANSVAGFFGDTGGDQIKSAASGLNAVQSVLPDVLRKVFEQNPNDENFKTAIETQLNTLLQQRGLANSATKRVSNLAVSNLDKEGFNKFLNEAGGDTSKVAEKTLASVAEPFRQIAEIEKRFTEAAQQYVNGLETLAQRQQQITQQSFRADTFQAEAQKNKAKLAAEKGGRRSDFFNFLPEGALQAPFQNLQDKLVGPAVNGLDPKAIGDALRETIAKVSPAEDALDKARSNRSNDEGAFKQAAQTFVGLKERASNLQTALKNLTDTSLRLSAIQERLSQLKQEEESSLGLGERLATADPEEISRLSKGALLAQTAQQQNFKTDNFSKDDLKALFEFTRSTGNIGLQGLGGITGNDLADNVRRQLFGGAFKLPDGKQKELDNLKGQEQDILQGAADAQKEVAAIQGKLQEDFFKRLGDSQTKFLEDLKNAIGSFNKNLADINTVSKISEKQRLESLSPDAKVLGGVGISTQDQVKALANAKDDINKLVQANKKISRIDAVNPQQFTKEGIADLIRESGGRPTSGNRVAGEDSLKFLQNLTEKLKGTGLDQSTSEEVVKRFADRQNSVTNVNSFQRNLEKSVTEVVSNQRSDAVKQADDARGKLGGPGGVLGDRVLGQIVGVGKNPTPDLNLGKLFQAAEAFSTSSVPLQNFKTELEKTTKELENLKAVAEAIGKLIPGAAPAVGRAGGGPIFKARGSDTVPAMLTPGEFVVNRGAASRNGGLLNAMNSGKVSFFADGGLVDPKKKKNAAVLALEAFAKNNPGGLAALQLARNNKDKNFGNDFFANQEQGLALRQGLANGIRRPGQEGQLRIQANAYAGLFSDTQKDVLSRSPGTLQDLGRFQLPQKIGLPGPLGGIGGVGAVLGKQVAGGVGINPEAVQAMNGFAKAAADFPNNAKALNDNIAKLNDAMSDFGDFVKRLEDLPEKFKGSLQIEGRQVVEVAGAVTLTNGQDGKQEVNKELAEYIGKSIDEAFKRRLPDLTA
jgi:TP901 family phage tail tape measure protein